MYAVNVVRDQVFSQVGGKPRLADLYLPQGLGHATPVILWVHGGGWRFGDRHLAPDLSRWFAERGFAMVSFDYRLSDEVTFPAQVFDVKTAIRWVRSIATQYSLNAEAIALWGSSAGGHLSAIAALTGEQDFISGEHSGFSSAVCAVVDGYGPTDFSLIDQDRIAAPPKVPDAETVIVKITVPTDHPDSFESRLIGVAVAKDLPEVQRANPVTYVKAGAPPFLILHGESDALIPWTQSRLLFDALRAAGNVVSLVLFERLGHGFFNNSDLDEGEIGPSTTFVSGTPLCGAARQPTKCFALCEEFFRRYLVDEVRADVKRDSVPAP